MQIGQKEHDLLFYIADPHFVNFVVHRFGQVLALEFEAVHLFSIGHFDGQMVLVSELRLHVLEFRVDEHDYPVVLGVLFLLNHDEVDQIMNNDY